MLKTHQRIITVEDLAEEARQAIINAQSEPLVVTENGRPTVYLISVDLFDTLVAQLELIEDAELKAYIAAGERQFAQGTYKTLAEATALAESAWQKQATSE
jgi:PHD/YefM family antitoxin component YafN of YafNO toxin-antitoxin module